MPQRIFPRQSSRRIFPKRASGRIFPLPANEAYFVSAGAAKYPLLGGRVYPFAELEIIPPSGVTVSTLEYQYVGEGSWTTVSLGSNPDLVTALKFTSLVVSEFWNRVYQVRVTFSDSATRTVQVRVHATVRGLKNKIMKSSDTGRVFGDAAYAEDASLIDTVKYEVSGATTVAKTDVPRELLISGTHDGSSNNASLVDTTTDFILMGVNVGDIVENDTDGSTATITAINTTTNSNDTVVGTLSGGTENDWDASDAYQVRDGANKIRLGQNFMLGSLSAGLNTVTLYIKDTSANEEADSCLVRVS